MLYNRIIPSDLTGYVSRFFSCYRPSGFRDVWLCPDSSNSNNNVSLPSSPSGLADMKSVQTKSDLCTDRVTAQHYWSDCCNCNHGCIISQISVQSLLTLFSFPLPSILSLGLCHSSALSVVFLYYFNPCKPYLLFPAFECVGGTIDCKNVSIRRSVFWITVMSGVCWCQRMDWFMSVNLQTKRLAEIKTVFSQVHNQWYFRWLVLVGEIEDRDFPSDFD